MSIGKLLGLDKMVKLGEMIKQHGGIRKSLYHLYWTDDLKIGNKVGEDEYGNTYYENNAYFYGRNRWIIYNPKHGVDFDASMVPATWYGWLHYKTDKNPIEHPPVNYAWMPKHTPNTSGSSSGASTMLGSTDAYMPYTTTKPKIESWIPPKN